MTITDKKWTLINTMIMASLFALIFLGGTYMAIGKTLAMLSFSFNFWLCLKHEPDQKQIRPAIKVLGWIFVIVAILASIASLISIFAGK